MKDHLDRFRKSFAFCLVESILFLYIDYCATMERLRYLERDGLLLLWYDQNISD